MNRVKLILAIGIITLVCFAACSPTIIKVIPLSPKAKSENNNEGIPYYLPKPYLLITKNMHGAKTSTTKKKETKKDGSATETTTTASEPKPPKYTETEKTETKKDGTKTVTKLKQTEGANIVQLKQDTYSYQIIYLPDLEYKYGVVIDRGKGGEFKNSISIVDGWKLTGINIEANTKTSENIGAVGELLGNALPALPFQSIKSDSFQQQLIESYSEQIKVSQAQLWLFELKHDNTWHLVYEFPTQ